MPDKHEATEVREMLDRFEEQNWDRHTGDAFESVEGLTKEMVEQGTLTPDCEVFANLDLTLKERITGRRKQKMTAMLLIGMMLGTAMERDVPMDSELEDEWEEGNFVLPGDDSE
jgi:hypothetical protein